MTSMTPSNAAPAPTPETLDPTRPDGDHDDHHDLDTIELVRIASVAVAVIASWSGVWRHVASFDLIGLVATLVGGYPIFHEAFESLQKRRMTMELSMTIALGAALLIGEFFTAMVIVLFVLVAEVLEHLTVGRGRDALRQLVELMPQDALIRRSGQLCEVRASELEVGQVVVVRPGSRIPVDGMVTAGTSFVDQATITGESMPVEKVPGAEVFAGTINQSGILEVQTAGIGRNTAFGRIVEAVEQAEKSRAPIQRVADRLAGYLVYFAIGCSVLTFLVTRDARATISVVIVAGACGIAAGTPLAILGGIGRAAREGAIVKGGLYLELLGTVDLVVFDKTGTVTAGRPQVTGIQPANGITQQELLEAASTAEISSEHPLGQAIIRKAKELAVQVREPDSFEYTPGRGIACRSQGQDILVGNDAFLKDHRIQLPESLSASSTASSVLVARADIFLGCIQVEDVLRPESRAAVAELRRMGIRTALLTGDGAAVGAAVGRLLAVDEVASQLLPDEKAEWIRRRSVDGLSIAMVGDGINDAPALTASSVGCAVGSGTDVARESADIVLLGNDLNRLVETIKIARRCRSIILTNFIGTLVVDGVGVGLAAFGYLNPLLAAFIHVTSELAFILNSARLLPSVGGHRGSSASAVAQRSISPGGVCGD